MIRRLNLKEAMKRCSASPAQEFILSIANLAGLLGVMRIRLLTFIVRDALKFVQAQDAIGMWCEPLAALAFANYLIAEPFIHRIQARPSDRISIDQHEISNGQNYSRNRRTSLRG